jgi:hypothetical protein
MANEVGTRWYHGESALLEVVDGATILAGLCWWIGLYCYVEKQRTTTLLLRVCSVYCCRVLELIAVIRVTRSQHNDAKPGRLEAVILGTLDPDHDARSAILLELRIHCGDFRWR